LVFIRSVAELATAYGALVLGKAAAFGVLMYLAALNNRRYAPGVAAGEAGAVRSFRRTTGAEWSVLVAVALMTALYAPAHLEGAFGSHLLEPHTGQAPSPSSPGAASPIESPPD